jgi:hypothetical protein
MTTQEIHRNDKKENGSMISVEAIMVDATHLELKTPLLKGIGKRYIIHIIDPEEEWKESTEQLKAAYLSMTNEERTREIDLAEEGLQGHPEFLDQFVNEEEDRWWE